MKKMLFLIILILSILIFSSQVPGKDLLLQNGENIKKLQKGMSRDEAISIMGGGKGVYRQEIDFEGHLVGYQRVEVTNPYREEQKVVNGQDLDIVYYFTNDVGLIVGYWDKSYEEGRVTDVGLTPLVFKKGKLIGWSWNLAREKEVFKNVDEQYYWMYWGGR